MNDNKFLIFQKNNMILKFSDIHFVLSGFWGVSLLGQLFIFLYNFFRTNLSGFGNHPVQENLDSPLNKTISAQPQQETSNLLLVHKGLSLIAMKVCKFLSLLSKNIEHYCLIVLTVAATRLTTAEMRFLLQSHNPNPAFITLQNTLKWFLCI